MGKRSWYPIVFAFGALVLVLADVEISAAEQVRLSSSNETRYSIMIDAGSSGSRVHIFAWQPTLCSPESPPSFIVPARTAHYASNPGLSSVDPSEIGATMTPMLEFAQKELAHRREHWHRFPIYVFATAGLRRLRPEKRDTIRDALREALSASAFQFEPQFVRILSGEEEGAYGWLALNAELGLLDNPQEESVGVLDLGGASMQITFVPAAGNGEVLEHAYPVLMRGEQIRLYSASYLQFGVKEAQRLLGRKLIGRTLIEEQSHELRHPCMPRGEIVSEDLITSVDSGEEGAPLRASWQGGGDFDECQARIAQLFERRSACYTPPCTFSGRYQPRLSGRRFVAFSTFSWVVETLSLNMNGTSLDKIENAARFICDLDWAVLQERWRDIKVEHLRNLCFSATYAVTLLTVGLGFDKKDRHIEFRGGQTVSWAVGAAIWEANNRFDPHQPRCLMPTPAESLETCPQ